MARSSSNHGSHRTEGKRLVLVAIQEDLPNAFALITRRMKALRLGEPERRVRGSDTEDPRMAHWSATKSREVSVLLS
jgi:hypothetical protein